MDRIFKKRLLVALIASMVLPLAASAADADLMNRIESMSRELEALKKQVKANEEKSAQTAEQVKAVAGHYFGDDQLTVAVLQPQPLDKTHKPRTPLPGARH